MDRQFYVLEPSIRVTEEAGFCCVKAFLVPLSTNVHNFFLLVNMVCTSLDILKGAELMGKAAVVMESTPSFKFKGELLCFLEQVWIVL